MDSSFPASLANLEERVKTILELGREDQSLVSQRLETEAFLLSGRSMEVRSRLEMVPPFLQVELLRGQSSTAISVLKGFGLPSTNLILMVDLSVSLSSTYWTRSLMRYRLLVPFRLLCFHQICTSQALSSSRQMRWTLSSNSQQRLSMGRDLNVILLALPSLQSQFEMSWYSTHSDATRRLEALVDSQPTLQQLLEYPDFLELLKAYHPKLLEYVSTSTDLPRDIVRFITEAPAESDSEARKYRLPLLTMLMVETNTTCVINSFFKVDPTTQRTFFLGAFLGFLGGDQQLLPLLCGYFSQLNLILWNNRYKETIDLVYEAQQPLPLLAKHCYSKAIVNTLLLYLNLDLTRNSNSPPERLTLKLQVIRQLYDQMREAFERYKREGEGSGDTVVENIGEVLVEIIEKYYLISDGKAMLEIITSQESVALVVEIFMQGGPIALAAANIVGWLMRYYCLSSFNTEDPQNPDLNKRNQERLESQPFPKLVIDLLPRIAETLASSKAVSLYQSKLVQIFNMSLQLSSRRVVEAVKRSQYLQMLVGLLFRFPQLSILHKMVEKLFFLIFNSDKAVFEDYRKHLFCQASLIEITVGTYLQRIPDLAQFRNAISSAHEGFFAYLMRIIKIYSKIQTSDEEINQSIMARSALWEQFSTFILQPFETLCFKDLGSYESVPERPPVEYSIKCITGGISNNQQVSKKVLEEISQEESMQKFKTQQPDKPQEEAKRGGGLSEDALFNVQEFNGPQRDEKKLEFEADISMPQNVSPDTFEHHLAPNPAIKIQIPAPKVNISHINPPETPPLEEPKKQPEPDPVARKYEEFLNSKKQEVDKEIKMQRTNSSEKRLSANKSRVTSPSPKKKRWDDSGSQEEEKVAPAKLVAAPAPAPKPAEPESKKQKISLTTPNMRPPMIPPSRPANHIGVPPKHDSKSEPKKVEAPIETSPRLDERFSNQQTVNTSINSLPEIKISDPVVLKEQEGRVAERSPSMGQLASSQLVQAALLEESRKLSKSAINLSDLKNVQFRRERVLKPEKFEYRKVEPRDRVLLDFLGVKY